MSVVVVLSSTTLFGWSHIYKKKLSEAEAAANKGKTEMVVDCTDVEPFTQMIVSWNAHRPAKGHFSFEARIKKGADGRWLEWHKVAEWGNGIQQSFMSENRASARHHHVRLEVAKSVAPTGFKIRVVAHNGADLSSIKGLFACTCDMSKFKPQDVSKRLRLPSVLVEGVPEYSQMTISHDRADSMCSPTSVSMLLGYLLNCEVDPLNMAYSVHDKGLDIFGNWQMNTAALFEASNGKYFCYPVRLRSFVDVHQYLVRGFPVPVSVRGHIDGAASAYKNGHILVVVGWDKRSQRVLVHDPAFETHQQVKTSYNLKSFLAAWERSRRMAYVTERSL